MLSALVIGVVLLLILPVSNYLRQKAQIEQIQGQIAEKQHQIGSLKDKNELLDDPAYIKSQARARLNYVLPGDKVYVVSDNSPGSPKDSQQKSAEKQKKKKDSSALSDLSDSIGEADKAK